VQAMLGALLSGDGTSLGDLALLRMFMQVWI
jgi:hypothetical protein